jgi:hypothetical protein
MSRSHEAAQQINQSEESRLAALNTVCFAVSCFNFHVSQEASHDPGIP